MSQRTCLFVGCNLDALPKSLYCATKGHKPVPGKIVRFSSDTSLEELESMINIFEKRNSLKLASLNIEFDSDSDSPSNEMSFDRLPSTMSMGMLKLIKFRERGERELIKDRHLQMGEKFLLDTSVSIAGEKTRVMVFREGSDISSNL